MFNKLRKVIGANIAIWSSSLYAERWKYDLGDACSIFPRSIQAIGTCWKDSQHGLNMVSLHCNTLSPTPLERLIFLALKMLVRNMK